MNDSEFEDIFDVDHFITSLRDEVRVLKQLPPRLKKRVELGLVHIMPPVSWSDISYYHNQVLFFNSVFNCIYLSIYVVCIVLKVYVFIECRFFH